MLVKLDHETPKWMKFKKIFQTTTAITQKIHVSEEHPPPQNPTHNHPHSPNPWPWFPHREVEGARPGQLSLSALGGMVHQAQGGQQKISYESGAITSSMGVIVIYIYTP